MKYHNLYITKCKEDKPCVYTYQETLKLSDLVVFLFVHILSGCVFDSHTSIMNHKSGISVCMYTYIHRHNIKVFWLETLQN